jgi:alpha-beta hydrolase superfamily lysophospholipase
MAIAPSDGTFESTGGAKIFYRSWRPAIAPKGVVAICHGFNSHSGQYQWVGEQFANRGFAVYALDLRGRGKSSGERFWVTDVAEYVADLAGLISLAKTREPGLKVFLLGHSAGGVISSTYTLDYQKELAGLICESFAFRVPAPRLALDAISWLSGFAPRLGVLKLKNRDFTRDPAALAALENDLLTQGENQPAKTVAALWAADKRLEKEFSRVTIPVLIMHGTADKATVPSGSQFFFDTTGSKDKTLKLYQDHFHDLFADVGREQVMEDTLAWIEARTS